MVGRRTGAKGRFQDEAPPDRGQAARVPPPGARESVGVGPVTRPRDGQHGRRPGNTAMLPIPIPLLALASLVATILMGFEVYASRRPDCPECPHCRALRIADEREQERLQEEYARRIGLFPDDDDRQGIG